MLQLQDRARRDPSAYRSEFLLQHQHYLAALEVLEMRPDAPPEDFPRMLSFLAHLATSYPAELADYPGQLMSLLDDTVGELEKDLRRSVVAALILLRNRDLVPATTVLPTFFRLFRVADKELRANVFQHIVADIRSVNVTRRDDRLNKQLQNYMFTMLKDENDTAAHKSLEVLIELFNRGIWADAKTANVISTAAFSPTTKMVATSLRFFLRNDDVAMARLGDAPSDSEDEDEDKQILQVSKTTLDKMRNMLGQGVKKKSKKAAVKVEKLKRKMKKSQKSQGNEKAHHSAIDQLHDPQGFAERLFSALKKRHDKFDVRLMMMNLISRLISSHKLLLLNYYPFAQRYLQPTQQHITHILSYIAEATHELVPPEDLQPVVQALANNFVTERNSNEAIAAGINCIRLIASRVPGCIESHLLRDLVEYKKHRDKGVVVAARGLIDVFRVMDPEALHKRDRGKDGAMSGKQAAQYGEAPAPSNMDDADILYSDEDSDDGEEEIDEEDKALALYEKASNHRMRQEQGNRPIQCAHCMKAAVLLEPNPFVDSKSDKWMCDNVRHRARHNWAKQVNLSAEDECYGCETAVTCDWAMCQVCWSAEGGIVPGTGGKASDDASDGEAAIEGAEGHIGSEEESEAAEGESGNKQRPRLAETRMLSSEELSRLHRNRLEQQAESLLNPAGRIDSVEIEGYRKKKKLAKQERIAKQMEGRDPNEKHGGGKKKAGTGTNADDAKNKNFIMIQRKRRRADNAMTLFQKKQKSAKSGHGTGGPVKKLRDKSQKGKMAWKTH